jgi:hypothetical protein
MASPPKSNLFTFCLVLILLGINTLQADALVRPNTPNFSVPLDLKPSLANAPLDRAINYADHCHVQQNQVTTTAPCIYGDTHSKTTVVLFGDSHALAWFPALNALAKVRHWKLYSQTMSSCNPADMKMWNIKTKEMMINCPIWREGAIKRIIKADPMFILMAGTRGFQTENTDGSIASAEQMHQIWDDAIKRTIKRFDDALLTSIIISDVPITGPDPISCLKDNPKSSIACAFPVSKAIDQGWLDTERNVSTESGVPLIEPQSWVCPTSPCPAIIGKTLVYLDSGHMTATFSATLSKRLGAAIDSALDGLTSKVSKD